MKSPVIVILLALLTGVCSAVVSASESPWEPPFVGSAPTTLYLPDAYATYWRYGWQRNPEDKGGYVFKGQFPQARYFSYNVYSDDSKMSLGSFADQQLKADAGKDNPFAGGQRGDATYTLHVVPEGTQIDAKNVLYFPDDLTRVSVLLRHYVPENGIEGGVPMPAISGFDPATGKLSVAAASHPVPSLSKLEIQRYLIPMFKDLAGQFVDSPKEVIEKIHHSVTGHPLSMKELIAHRLLSKAFTHYHKGEVIESYKLATTGTYPNQDNLYLILPAVREADEVLLVKFRAPSYPKSPADYPAAPLRYFSLSQGDNLSYGSGTLIDKDMRVNADGNIYFLIGDEQAALRDKASALGANFMPWKATNEMLLVYRHMLPKADYVHGINQVADYVGDKPEKGQEGRAFIGDYAPVGRLISHTEALGLKAFPVF